MLTRARPALLLLALAALGCPQRVHTEATKDAPPAAGAADPRVHADTDDLYRATPITAPAPADPALGSGAPDETNGVCRLFAPKLPAPECCPHDLGMDVEVVRRACGHALYLGESLQISCGYFFSGEDTSQKPRWLRLSYAQEPTAQAAAAAHDQRIGLRLARDPNFRSDPVPGVPDAYWSRHERLRWAFVPGWSRPRLLSWSEESCSDEGIVEVIRHLAGTPEIPADAPRRALLPGGPPAVAG